MNRLVVVFAMLAIVVSCSDEDTVIKPEPCNPFFHAESLAIEVQHVFLPHLKIWAWDVTATYKYELEGCSGKIHTHEFTFFELEKTLIDFDDTIADCIEPVNVQLDKDAGVLTTEDLFNGYDSVTVYFTLRGLFQQCSGGSSDSIAAIVWSDTVRTEIID